MREKNQYMSAFSLFSWLMLVVLLLLPAIKCVCSFFLLPIKVKEKRRAEKKRKKKKRKRHTPTKHINRQRPSQRPSLQQKITRKLSNHIRNIKNRRQPRILLSHQFRIRPQPKNRLCSQGCFVGLLNAVAEPHERE